MSTDTSRDEFEAWAYRECMDIRRSEVDGRYLGEGRVDLFWRAWQASRSSDRASIRAEWLPIETAPVAKNLLLIWRPIDHEKRPFHREVIIGSLTYDAEYKSDGYVHSGSGMLYSIATHILGWMPLPEVPQPPALGATTQEKA